jgi:hypothetical protein
MPESLFYFALIGLVALAWFAIWLLTRLDLLEDGMEYDDPRIHHTEARKP